MLRDSYYCGVQYGHYDIDRLISSFSAYQKQDENLLFIALEHGGIHALEEFVLARYFMFIQVYYHKTRRYLDKKLADCLKRLLPGQKYPSDAKEYLCWDDNRVLELIQQRKISDPYAAEFASREVLTCVYQAPVHTDRNGIRLYKTYCRDIKEKILEEGIDEADLPRYYYNDEIEKLAHKIPDGFGGDEGDIPIPILIKHQKEPSSVYDESLLLRSLKDPIAIKRIYVHKSLSKLAEAVINI